MDLDQAEIDGVQSVLVTGAAGFIGSHLAEACLNIGWRVLAVDSFTDYYPRELKASNAESLSSDERCVFIETDLMNADLAQLISEVDVVFHLAAQPGVRPSWGDGFDGYIENNLVVLQRLLEAAREKPSVRLVLASSSSVYGDADQFPVPENVILRPVSPYGMTKAAGEHLAHVYWRSYGTHLSMLRYFTVYGPRQRPDMAFHKLIQSAVHDREFKVYGDGRQTRDFTYVADAVSGTISAGVRGQPGRAYNIGGGSRHSLNSVIEELGQVSGKPMNVTYVDAQRGDARDTNADVTRASEDLGYAPSLTLSEGLRKQYAWHETNAMLLS